MACYRENFTFTFTVVMIITTDILNPLTDYYYTHIYLVDNFWVIKYNVYIYIYCDIQVEISMQIILN